MDAGCIESRRGARGKDGEEARGTSSMASHTAAFRPRAGVEGPSIPYTVIVRMVLGGVLGYKAQRDERLECLMETTLYGPDQEQEVG